MGRPSQTVGAIDFDERHFDVPPPINDAYRPQQLGLQTDNFDVGDYARDANLTPAKSDHKQSAAVARKTLETRDSDEAEMSDANDTYGNGVTFRELVVYCVYLVVVSIVAFSMTSSATFYFTNSISELLFKNPPPNMPAYSDIAEVDDVWTYLENQLMTALYWNQADVVSPSVDTSNDPSMVYYENRLLGYPRLRMLKVTNQSCEVVESFRREIKECFGAYSEDREDRSDIDSSFNSTAFFYQPEEILQAGRTTGDISTYGGGGYVQDLSISNASESFEVLTALEANRWITRGSRVLFVDFSLYNANLNLFSAIKLIIELPATGGVVPTYSLSTMKLIRYVSGFDFFVLVCEGIFCAFIVYFFVEEVCELIRWRLLYFYAFWTYIDLCVIGVSCAAIAFSLRRTTLVNQRLPSLTDDIVRYENMSAVVNAEATYSDCSAILLFFAWIKVFKYIGFNKTMSQLSSTISRSAKDIGGFAVMFCIFFFAYAQFGYLVFGTQIEDYSTFYSSTFALLRTILGDFDFNALETANRILGPIFFITYVFFVFFVLLNMFLAIINDSYVEVKMEMKHSRSKKIAFVEFLSKHFFVAKRKLGLSKNADTVDPSADYDEWKRQLQRRGYSDTEINELFAKYDVRSGEDKNGMQNVTSRNAIAGESKSTVVPHTVNGVNLILDQRVEKVELAISLVADRVENIVQKLTDIQTKKAAAEDYGSRFQFQNAAEGMRQRPPNARPQE